MPTVKITPPYEALTLILFMAAIFCLMGIGLYMGFDSAPRRAYLEMQQARREARITGLLPYCVKGGMIQANDPRCIELTQYVGAR